MKVGVDIFVKAEAKFSIEANPSDGTSLRKSQIGSGAAAAGEFAFKIWPVLLVPFDHKIRVTGQEREGLSVVQTGIEKDKTIAVSERPGGFLRGQSRR